VNVTASSASELIFYLIKTLDIELDKRIAVSLFTGMMTDTIRFLTSSCTPDFYYIIAELVKYGADPSFIGTNVYMRNSISSIRMLGSILSDFKLICDDKLSYCIITEERKTKFNVTADDTNTIINNLLGTNGVESALMFEIEGDMIHLSMRSKTKFDVGEIARELGGGGHINAAGTAILGDIDVTFKDSILASKPYFEINLTDINNENVFLQAYRKESGAENLDLEGNPIIWNRDRLYANITQNNVSTFVLIQYYVFDPLIKNIDYFNKNYVEENKFESTIFDIDN
jgi:hypothetical protein